MVKFALPIAKQRLHVVQELLLLERKCVWLEAARGLDLVTIWLESRLLSQILLNRCRIQPHHLLLYKARALGDLRVKLRLCIVAGLVLGVHCIAQVEIDVMRDEGALDVVR